MPSSTLDRLVNIYEGRCHYCNCQTTRKQNSRTQATKDHVVPRSFGGQDIIGNYVLACHGCNNERGTALFYCRCGVCNTMIQHALHSDEFVNTVFNGIVSFNKPKITCVNGLFVVRRGSVFRQFNSFQQAIHYARNGSFKKGE